MKNQIHHYIKGKFGQRRGIVLARELNENLVGVGWAVCNKKDVYDTELGMRIAFGRAEKGAQEMPFEMKWEYYRMAVRAQHYFKSHQIVVNPVNFPDGVPLDGFLVVS